MAGTIFQNTKIPLTKWFRAMWEVVRRKKGANALTLSSELKVKYDTAWNLLQKVRRAMVFPGSTRLSGLVEIDETLFGGFSEGQPGQTKNAKVRIIGAIELKKEKETLKTGRMRLQIIDSANAESLLGFVHENVEKGSRIITDEWREYSQLKDFGHDHHVDANKRKEDTLPHAHLVFSLFKRWILATHQGAVSREHLMYYLDEFVFCYNRRTSKNRGLLFHHLLENAVRLSPVTREEINTHSSQYHGKK
jgi:transposase-like protein